MAEETIGDRLLNRAVRGYWNGKADGLSGNESVTSGLNSAAAQLQLVEVPRMGREASRTVSQATEEAQNTLHGTAQTLQTSVQAIGSFAHGLQETGKTLAAGHKNLKETFQNASNTVEGARGAVRTVQNLAHGVGAVFTWLDGNKAEEPAANEERYAAGNKTPAGPDEPGPAIMASSPPSGPDGP